MENKSTIKLTPMMSQYLRIKSKYPNILLFYRMGDFYELFFEDAIIASSILNITLTKRGKINGKDIEMCGVPHHSSENYLINLIKKGYKVAICEQTETPEEAKKRGYNSVVNREVTRLITPGTVTEDTLLDHKSHNFLMTLIKEEEKVSSAWIDISTGDFFVSSLEKNNINDFVNKIQPSEIVISKNNIKIKKELEKNVKVTFSIIEDENFNNKDIEYKNPQLFNNKYSLLEKKVIRAILNYIQITQKKNVNLIKAPLLENEDKFVKIDNATRKNLEVMKTIQGEKKGTLLDTINKTATPLGSRLLSWRLQNISTDLNEIHNRLKDVSFFYENVSLSEIIRNNLKLLPDIERSLSRIILMRGGPKDIGIIRDSLRKTLKLKKIFDENKISKKLDIDQKNFEKLSNIFKTLDNTIVENPPSNSKEEIYISAGICQDLDNTIKIRQNAKNIILIKQSEYIEKFKINSLKIKYNNFLGYFFEIPIKHKEKLFIQNSNQIISRQSTLNTFRFTTTDLIKISEDIINADQKINEIQNKIFHETITFIQDQSLTLKELSNFIAKIDVSVSIARISQERNWVKPKLDKSNIFIVKKGRHPVVEYSLIKTGKNQFISNDCNLDDKKTNIMLITGPNMSGKSTFMRQNALIAILAHMGSYVPADYAHIGLVDQIFSRVGASDDLGGGRSTFMVEMSETALILNNASKKSLLILDEIGRGTSTYDGLSIAWATLEYIHNVNCSRTLFATHYFELTQLENILKKLKNYKINVKEWKEEIIFLHKVSEGISSKSYGIQVAKIAGIPEEVIKNSSQLLEKLEKETQKICISTKVKENNYKKEKKDIIFEKIKNIDIEKISPLEALNILDKLVKNNDS